MMKNKQAIIIIIIKLIVNKKKEPAELWTLPSQQTTDFNYKKAKRELSTLTLLEKWKTMEHQSDGNTICNWPTWNNSRKIGIGTGTLGNKRKSGAHQGSSIIEISQNTEKSPRNLGDLLSLKPLQKTMSVKTSQKSKIIMIIITESLWIKLIFISPCLFLIKQTYRNKDQYEILILYLLEPMILIYIEKIIWLNWTTKWNCRK